MNKVLKSKTFLIIASILVILLVLCLALFMFLNAKPTTYNEVSYEEFRDLEKSGDSFILFIGSNSCSHCTIFKVAVNEVVAKYGVVVNYIDVSKLTDKQYAYLNGHLSFSGTPTTVLIKSGNSAVEERVLRKIRGSETAEEFSAELKKYGFIK